MVLASGASPQPLEPVGEVYASHTDWKVDLNLFPKYQTVKQGQSITYTFAINVQLGNPGNFRLVVRCVYCPSGVNVGFPDGSSSWLTSPPSSTRITVATRGTTSTGLWRIRVEVYKHDGVYMTSQDATFTVEGAPTTTPTPTGAPYVPPTPSPTAPPREIEEMPFRYALSIAPESQTLTGGGYASYQVRVSYRKGTSQPVALRLWVGEIGRDARGEAVVVASVWSRERFPWLSFLLAPSVGTPPFTSTLVVSVDPQRRYRGPLYLIVEGVDGGVQEKSNPAALVVEEAFRLEITAREASKAVNAGDEVDFEGEVSLLGGEPEEVELFVGPVGDVLRETVDLELFPRLRLSPDGNPLGTPPFGWRLRVVTSEETLPGTYSFAIGVRGHPEVYRTLTLRVSEPFAFDIVVERDHRSISLGEEASYPLVVHRTGGLPKFVELTMGGEDFRALFERGKATWGFDGKPMKLDAPADAFATTLTIRPSLVTAPGVYRLRIDGRTLPPGAIHSASREILLAVRTWNETGAGIPLDLSRGAEVIEYDSASGEWRLKARPARLAPGERLQTGKDGRAQLTFEDGGVVKLGPDSEATASEILDYSLREHIKRHYEAMEEVDENPSFVSIFVGVLWAHRVCEVQGLVEGEAYAACMYFSLPGVGALLGLYGTEVVVEVARNGTSTLTVLEGTVSVTRDLEPGKVVSVGAGERLVIAPEAPLASPTPIDIASLERWWLGAALWKYALAGVLLLLAAAGVAVRWRRHRGKNESQPPPNV
ncbi:MAG: hypothetical protein HY555_00200 [Euryarchaeota archaeon]|nr:hypothetical protein [Euryarchaeota archaeon]